MNARAWLVSRFDAVTSTARVSRAAPVLVSVVFLALYAATPVEVHRFDALSDMLAAQSTAPRFDPHHLLYTRLARLFPAHGDVDRLIVAMQSALRALLVAWIVLYVPFIVWWEPDNTVHWQFALLPLIAIVMWTAELIAPRSRIALGTPRRWSC